MKSAFRPALAPLILLLAGALSADDSPNGSWTEFQAFDDWPAFNMLAEGRMWCPGAELTWENPLLPNCGDGKRFNIREAEMFSCLTGMDMEYNVDPRLSGTMWFNINANLDSTFSGTVFGEFVIVPGETCDPDELEAPAVYWAGTWQGKRSQICDPTCSWVGTLHIVGHGYGGDLDGLEFRGEEVITTYTELPAPWDHIPGFPYTEPEGIVHGYLKE
jgi:hypothetical protein